jgi:Uncharacterised nucleotidyltransferase
MARLLCGEDEYPAPLLAVAGYTLPGAGRPFPALPLDGPSWAEVLAGARTHRLTGLLGAATADGTFPATTAQVTEARAVHRRGVLRVMALEGELVAVVDRLGAVGVEVRVLKGSAVAHLDYADPALRSFVDLDVLVRAEDIERAVAALGEAGFRRTLAEPRPGFDRRFDKGMTLVPPTGYELDLHRTFVLGPWGVVMDPDRLWDERDEFLLGARAMPAMSRPHRFLHACYHAALGDWPLRLGSLRDVAEILPRLQGAETAVRERAAEWGVEAVVAAAVADAHRLLGLPARGDLARWARGHVPTPRDESWLALHTRADKTFAAQALATLRVLPGWADKVAYLRALALPDRRYTGDRHASLLARFRYGISEARRGSRRTSGERAPRAAGG